jgi:hypothetical protein
VKRFIFVALILSAALTLTGASVSKAESLTDTQLESIKANCFTVRNTLKQLHTSDTVLRVNIGQRYESMSTKLMGRFNRRVAANGLQNTSLLQATRSYTQSLDVFRSAYRAYEEQLSTVTKIDCNNKPLEFYEAIISAREKREGVHSSVVRLGEGLEAYAGAVDRFEIDFKAVGGAL